MRRAADCEGAQRLTILDRVLSAQRLAMGHALATTPPLLLVRPPRLPTGHGRIPQLIRVQLLRRLRCHRAVHQPIRTQ